jgi:hypothetical protein
MLNIIPDYDSKKALNLRNHYEPIIKYNQKITCEHCGKRHFPDEETFIVIYGNITVGFRGGIIGNNFAQNGQLFRAAIFCRNEKCIGNLLSKLIEDEMDSDLEENEFKDEDNLRNCSEIG